MKQLMLFFPYFVIASNLFFSNAASAALIAYSDLSSWNNRVSGVSTVTIPDPPLPDQYEYFGSGDASVNYGGLVFSTSSLLSDGEFYNIGTLFSGSSQAVLSSQNQTTGIDNIRITFASAVHGFALNYGTFLGNNVTFTLSNGGSVTQLSSGGVSYDIPDFVGVTDTNSFTWVQVTSPDFALNLNNVSSARSIVPEPSTFVLLALAGIGLGLRIYGRKFFDFVELNVVLNSIR